MSIHQMTANDLQSHAETFEHLPEIIFAADANQDKFDNVQVITLQQYYKDLAYEKAWDMIDKDHIEDIEEIAERICLSEHAQGKEFVEIKKNSVIICLNTKSITDAEITRGLAYLVSIDDFSPGEKYVLGLARTIHYEFASKVSPIDS